MISEEQALVAANKLACQIKQPKWLTGSIGVGKDRSSYVLFVYVDKLTDKLRQEVPMSIDGVPVQLHEVGKVKPVAK
jgi:hypothetical protein